MNVQLSTVCQQLGEQIVLRRVVCPSYYLLIASCYPAKDFKLEVLPALPFPPIRIPRGYQFNAAAAVRAGRPYRLPILCLCVSTELCDHPVQTK